MSAKDNNGKPAHGTAFTPEYVLSCVEFSPAAVKSPDRSLDATIVLLTGTDTNIISQFGQTMLN